VIPLLVVLTILLVLVLLLLLRVRIVVTVREGVTLTARVLCLSFRLFPRKRKRVRWSKRATARAARKKRRKEQRAAKKAAKKARKRRDGHAVGKPAAKPTLRENLRLVRCKIIGTQPFCYAKNLVLEDCEMVDCDLSFENTTVQATVKGEITSVKNPAGGSITADRIGEIILDEYQWKLAPCTITEREKA